jgi:hypothetical protein
MYPNPERKRNRGYLGHDSSALPPRDSQDRHQLRYELDLNSWNLRIWGVAASGFLTDSCVLMTLSLSAKQRKRIMSLTVFARQIQPLCFQCHPLHSLVCLLPPRPVVWPSHQPLHAPWVGLSPPLVNASLTLLTVPPAPSWVNCCSATSLIDMGGRASTASSSSWLSSPPSA